MAKDDPGREGRSAGAIARELDVSPARVKRALVDLRIEADFVKSNCNYYHDERVPQVRAALK
jgi:hypothetical protein